MEGLEITETRLNEVNSKESFGRFDADFFKKDSLVKKNTLRKHELVTIGELADVTDGQHGSPDLDETSGIIYLSGHNIKDNLIDLENVRYCTKRLREKNLRSSLSKGNVLMSIVGTVGRAAAVRKEVLGNTDRNVATIKNIDKRLLPAFLAAYLNCSYGSFQTKRFSTGNVQPLLNLLQVKAIMVPLFTSKFQNKIEVLCEDANDKLDKSILAYKSSSSNFFSELKLLNWQPIEEGKAVKRFSESFGVSGRLDAEYYQPKYDEVVSIIKGTKHDTLNRLASIKKSIEPGSDAYLADGIPFLRIADVSKFGISAPEHYLDRGKYDLDELKPKKDTILLTKDGSVGIAYKVEEDMDAVTSSALLHLKVKSKEVLPDYLTLVLNSKLTQMQAERDAGGSIIQHWRIDEIKNVLIPILSIGKQREISEQIQKSFALRKESVKLLEVAKKAVEIAIEKSEEEAIRFIEANK